MRRVLIIALAFFAVLVAGTAATGGVQALITGADIKDFSIGSNDLKSGAVYSHDIRNGTIARVDLSPRLLSELSGTTGAQGAKGDQGATGATGAQGDKGATGAQGAPGDKGATGAQGAKGDQGATGATGATGAQGARGDQGAAGPKGDKGDRGEPGTGISGLEADGPYPGRPDTAWYLQNLRGQGAQSTALWANDGTLQSSWVMCAPGKVALGGGFGQNDYTQPGAPSGNKLVIVTSVPTQIDYNFTTKVATFPYRPIAGDLAGSIVPNGWLVEGYNTSGGSIQVRPWVICATLDHDGHDDD